jgi:hypothetical protein
MSSLHRSNVAIGLWGIPLTFDLAAGGRATSFIPGKRHG